MLQKFIPIELDSQSLTWTERKIIPVSFIDFAGSLVQNCSLHSTDYAVYGIPVIHVKKVLCKGYGGSWSTQPLGGRAAEGPLLQPRSSSRLGLAGVTAIPCYTQRVAPPARACVVISVYGLLLFSCFWGKLTPTSSVVLLARQRLRTA